MDLSTNELQSAGLKLTSTRRLILRVFHDSTVRHLDVEDVYRILRGSDSSISLATIYRVLAQFEQAGLLKRQQFRDGKASFELTDGPQHDHMVSVNTGEVTEFRDAEIERRIRDITAQYGLELIDYALNVHVLAPEPPIDLKALAIHQRARAVAKKRAKQ